LWHGFSPISPGQDLYCRCLAGGEHHLLFIVLGLTTSRLSYMVLSAIMTKLLSQNRVGVYFSGFWFSLYINITATRGRSTHSRVYVFPLPTTSRYSQVGRQIMVAGSIVMFILASLHVGEKLLIQCSYKIRPFLSIAMNGYRLLQGFTDFQSSPGGPVGYLGVLSTCKDTPLSIFADIK
jgi:hypothetical protein